MATTPVNGVPTDTTQGSGSNNAAQTQFDQAFESMMVNMTMQFIQNVQVDTGTTPTDLWDD